ncbi:Uncharacterised protein [Nocardia otitidiscaviarum]|uniref:Uncharacterized protein n=1 Tax=Nocardia otitidiscaviarum TaxID=1823 RepID=A0A379JMJ0_9NOCA|nr:Uncharacterised protein [Nocardia otitidiscaviarum]
MAGDLLWSSQLGAADRQRVANGVGRSLTLRRQWNPLSSNTVCCHSCCLVSMAGSPTRRGGVFAGGGCPCTTWSTRSAHHMASSPTRIHTVCITSGDGFVGARKICTASSSAIAIASTVSPNETPGWAWRAWRRVHTSIAPRSARRIPARPSTVGYARATVCRSARPRAQLATGCALGLMRRPGHRAANSSCQSGSTGLATGAVGVQRVVTSRHRYSAESSARSGSRITMTAYRAHPVGARWRGGLGIQRTSLSPLSSMMAARVSVQVSAVMTDLAGACSRDTRTLIRRISNVSLPIYGDSLPIGNAAPATSALPNHHG